MNMDDTREVLEAAGVIRPSEPTTGVFSIHDLEWIHNEVECGDSIDLTFEEFCHNECPYRDPELDCTAAGRECPYEEQSDTYLIGFWLNPTSGKYEPKETAEWSAIVRYDSQVVQVVRSQYGIQGGLCSPCYPGQVDASNEAGDILAYSVPPDIVGYEDIEADDIQDKFNASVGIRLASRIFPLSQGFSPAGRWIEHKPGENFTLYSQILDCVDFQKQEYRYRLYRRPLDGGEIEASSIFGAATVEQILSDMKAFGDQWIEPPIDDC